MQDSLAKARQLYDEKAKEAQQRQDKVNAAFDKTIENAEKTAANPALDALAEEFAKLGKGAATATDPLELFGKANGIAGKELEQLAIDAEKFGPNADLAREALNGMKDASSRATSNLDLFGRENGIAGDALVKLAIAEERRRAATDSATAAEKRRKEFVEGNLGVWDKTANQLQRFYESLGFDPAWLEQKRKAEREAYESNLKAFYEAKKKRDEEIAERIRKREEAKQALEDKYEAKRQARAEKRRQLEEQAVKDYEAITKFSESLSGWWNGENGEGPNMPETEETLPELQTQTQRLGELINAVGQIVLQPVSI